MTDHAHHWLIESPNGTPTVGGVCRVCGAARTFWTVEKEISVHDLFTAGITGVNQSYRLRGKRKAATDSQ